MAIVSQTPVRAERGAPVAIVALDFAALDQVMALVDELGSLCRFYKVGSELFTAEGPAAVSRLRAHGCEVMLDLKFHDIPNTVAGAVGSARALGARILTIHATGGEAMIRAAVDAAGGECQIFAVTLLTSLDAPAASAVWGRGAVEVSREVVRLATLARDAGVAGVVASGSEVRAIKAELGPGFKVLVPGVRPTGTARGDQRRVVSPGEASRLGADYVVVGRTVTTAANRRGAMEKMIRELSVVHQVDTGLN
ncbi:MAG: orotidine-5'-phosphate decarboxylase [Gemmatimonadaceae bacterium]|nr:orotidine-5'-phosphate decarboxylase [Gemmatimonadaceae bacterium]